ncbi:MAG TPA: hypothetical protein VF456_15790 [Vicinamibacterales bacterium]
MAFLNDLKQMLSQYTSGTAPSGDTAEHFQQVAQSVDRGTLAQGIAAVMRSDDTPPFSQLASQLFASGSGEQKLAMLTTLFASVPPDVRAQLSSMIPGLGEVTSPAAAQAVSPDAVQQLAEHAEQHDVGIVDRMSALYAAHPGLIKTLGSAAMMIAMRTIAAHRQPA